MKQIAVYLLIAALITLPGCRRTESGAMETTMPAVGAAQNILLTEPPAMTVRCGDGEATVGSGNYTWEADGACAIACGIHPTSLWEGEPTLITSAGEVEMVWAVMPDSITARCWSNARSTETWDEEFPAEVAGNILILDPECQIYEITAVWDSAEDYGGRASYPVFIMPQE